MRIDVSGKPHYGFTLIEIMLVLSIIALLMAILIPTVGYARRKAKASQVAADFEAIGRALEGFNEHFGFYPPKPNPTRPTSGDPSRHNIYIWYYLVKCDYNMNDTTDGNEQSFIDKGNVYLEFPDDRFNSNHLLLDPWGTPYGLLLPSKASGWSSDDGNLAVSMPYRIWSNGPNLTTDSSSPGMDGIDDCINVDFK